jgi:hypothetical protein
LVWQNRLTNILSADPALADQFQQLLDEVLIPALPAGERTRIAKIEMNAKATGHSRIYQAARDQHIRES